MADSLSIRRTFKRILKWTRDEFDAIYKGCMVDIDREKDDDLGGFYITVISPTGCFLYDGWWRESEDMQRAAFEALYGAQLLPRPNRPNDAQAREDQS